MKADNIAKLRAEWVWLTEDGCRIEDFARLVERTTEAADYPFAESVRSNVLVYDCDALRAVAESAESRKALMAEWVEAMMDGPGIIVLKRAFLDPAPIDAATAQFEAMIEEQKEGNSGGGDHFAKAGANDRVWNALEKLCLRDPEIFAAYYANDMIALVSEAWLGPGYQVTSQLNVVNPGGEAQSPHRDYHLGFQTAEEVARYQAHIHRLSPALTLQGAVAHCDMPLESGPTLYLPYSQTYLPGYLAWRKPEFRDYFDSHRVQLPLAKGDAVFFNPAVFHGAGNNRSRDIRRMANLLQVSSPYGRAMESVGRSGMGAALFPALRAMLADGRLTWGQAANAVAACAEGYAFPTNLDRDPPVGGPAPQSQQGLMLQALDEDWDAARLKEALEDRVRRSLT